MSEWGERTLGRRDFIITTASCTGLALAGCTGFNPPDPRAPETQRWAMPLADAENTASNGATQFPATGFEAPWGAGGSGGTTGHGDDQIDQFSAAATDDAVYAAYGDAGIVRHQPGTGTVSWRAGTGDGEPLDGRPSTPPTYVDATAELITVTSAGTVYGIDGRTGEITWSLTDDEVRDETGVRFDSESVGRDLTVTPQGRVLLADDSGSLVAIESGSGRIAGATSADLGSVTGPPIATEEAVIATYTGGIQSVERDGLDDDTERDAVWSALLPAGGTTYADVPAIHHQGILVVATGDGLVGIDATPENRYEGDVVQEASAHDDPRTLWVGNIGTVTGHGTRVGNVVVFPRENGGQEGLVAVATGTGSVIWSRPVTAGVAIPPVSSHGLVYVVDGAGDVQVVDALTGETVGAGEVGVTDGTLAVAGDTLVVQGTDGTVADERISPGGAEGDTDSEAGTIAIAGDQSRATLEHLHENVLAVAEEMEQKTANRIVPRPLEDEEAVNVIDEAGRRILSEYDDGGLSYDVARGVFERLTWTLQGSDLLLTATRARQPERDNLFIFNSTPRSLTGYNTDDALSSLGYTEPEPLEPKPFEEAMEEPGNSIAAHSVYGLIRTGWNVVMLLPLARVAGVSRQVLSAGSIRPLLRNLRALGSNVLKMLRDLRSFISTARKSVSQALSSQGGASGIVWDIAKEILSDLPEEAFVEVSDRGTRMLTGIGISDLIQRALERIAAEIADASVSQYVEQPESTNVMERSTEERVGDPRTDEEAPAVEYANRIGGRDSTLSDYSRSVAGVDGWFDGYTVYEAIDAAVQKDLVDGLTEQNQIPGNRQGSANSAAARYREMLSDITEFTESRALLDWSDLYPDDMADDLRDVFDVTENPELIQQRIQVELSIFATELLWGIIDDLTDIPGGIAQYTNGKIAVSNQARLAHGRGLEDIMYGVDVEGGL